MRRKALIGVVFAIFLAAQGGLAARSVHADSAPQISIDDVTQVEGNSGTVNYVFTVTLGYKANVEVDVNFVTQNGSAIAPGDYQSATGTLVFTPGQTTKTIVVAVNGDTIHEANEVFYVNLSGSINGVISDGSGQGLIIDDDPQPYVAIGNATVTEGDSGTVNATFPVTLSNASAQQVSLHYSTVNGTALMGSDYVYTQGSLKFLPGDTSKTISVPVNGDTIVEATEYFYVNLSSIQHATSSNSLGIGYITNDDLSSTLSVSSPTVFEGNSGTANEVFTVTLQPASTTTVTTFFQTVDGSATLANNDYVQTLGSLTFTPGQTTKTVNVPVVGDTTAEPDEYFYLSLGSISGAIAVNPSGQGAIMNDDPSASTTKYLQVSDATVVEGNSGTATMTFTVTLSPSSTSTVTVNYGTSDNSATAPSDYTSTSGTLTFTSGQTTKTINVPIVGDTLQETDELFSMNLSSASGATIWRNPGYGRIINNDFNPNISISYPAIAEGNSGTSNAIFTVSLSAASANTVQVGYATSDGSATAGSDYVAKTGTLTFSPGTTSQNISIVVNGDTIRESDEYFAVYLSSAVNGVIINNPGNAYIINDDFSPTLTVGDVSVYEGQTGTKKAVFKVKLSSASPNTVQVNYATSDGSAIAGSDYTATSGSLTFNSGITSMTATVLVTGDTRVEGNEYFLFYLSAPVNADIADNQAYGYIIDDDANPVMSIGDASVVEGNSATTNAVFPVTLSSASFNTITVNFGTSDGSAVAASDYVAQTGSLTFNPGDLSKNITIAVDGDTVPEADEYFNVYLSSPLNATVQDNQAYGYILNDDVTPTLSITSTATTEGNSGSHNVTLNVNLSPSSPNIVTVNYGTADGSAVATSDYTATSGTLTFNPGDTTKPVVVSVNGDTTVENSEYFVVNLSSASSNATIVDATGYAEIVNDDAGGQPATSYLSAGDATVVEGNSGTVNETFTVTLAPSSTSTVNVNYATSNGTALDGTDYVGQVGTLTFAPGQTSKTVSVAVNGDTIDEANRYFYLTLSPPTNSTILKNQALGTILDDDVTPRLWIGDATVVEPNSGTVDAVFTVTLSAASTQPVYADYTTQDGSAIAPGDYTADSGTLQFNPGETSKTITIPVNGDNLIEGTETFELVLSGGANTVISDNDGTGTILDMDTFTDSGTVLAGDGTPIAGVSMKITGNNRPTVTVNTAADGTYSFATLPDGTYTVTPTLAGFTFFPTKTTVLISGANVTGTNFLGATGAFIEGQVVDSKAKALGGVTVTRTGNSQPTVVSTTNAQGYYAFSSNATGTYTVTPTKSGYTFNPVKYTPAVGPGSSSNDDFVAVKPAYITGRVVDGSGNGVAGVTLTRTGGSQPSATAKTNSQGYYGFSANPASVGGTTYTITPTITGHTFSPASAPATVSTSTNATGINFTEL